MSTTVSAAELDDSVRRLTGVRRAQQRACACALVRSTIYTYTRIYAWGWAWQDAGAIGGARTADI
eukprot:scaffold26686_cov122-Isochrysis_galbana.AAC.4